MSNAVLNSHVSLPNSRQRNIHTGETVQMQTEACINFATTYTSPKAFLPIIWVIISKDTGPYPSFIFFWGYLIKFSGIELCHKLRFFLSIVSGNFPFLQSSITPIKTMMTILLFLNRRQVCHIMAWWRSVFKKSICPLLKTTKAQKYDLNEL